MPFALYVAFVARFQSGVPIHDDYIVQLELAQILKAATIKDKISLLFSQLNEHRLFYTRVCFLIDYSIDHQLSYSSLIWIGNLPLLGIFVLLSFWLSRIRAPIWSIPCLAWVLFQNQYFENSLWAMAGLQNITIHFLYVLLFTLLVGKPRVAWGGALVVACLICFTSGNGFLALFLGTFSLVIQRRWKHTIIWIALTLTLIICYFSGYQGVGGRQVLSTDGTNLWKKIPGLFIFLGQICNVHSRLAGENTMIIAGGLIFCIASLCILSSLHRLRLIFSTILPYTTRDRFTIVLLQTMLFVILSGAILVQNRLDAENYIAMTASRYQLYPTMLLLAVFCFLSDRLNNTVIGIILILSITVWVLIFQHTLTRVCLFRDQALAGYFNSHQISHPDPFFQKLFVPDKQLSVQLAKFEQVIAKPAAPNLDHSVQVIQKKHVLCPDYLVSSDLDNLTFVVLYNSNLHFLFPALVHRNSASLFLSSLKGKSEKGMMAPVMDYFLVASPKPATYRIGVLVKENGILRFSPMNAVFEWN